MRRIVNVRGFRGRGIRTVAANTFLPGSTLVFPVVGATAKAARAQWEADKRDPAAMKANQDTGFFLLVVGIIAMAIFMPLWFTFTVGTVLALIMWASKRRRR